jgi:phospholipid/cholesterol/gamma-HCH transport system substrate-binding protein
VWYAGFEVGAVKNVRIAKDVADRIAITINISPEARVRKDSHTEIRSMGMMGAKYVEISPGSPDSPELASGDTLEGKSPASLTEILETGQKVAARLLDLVQEANTLVHEVRTEYAVRDTIQNANGMVTQFRQQVAELGPVMKNMKQVTGEGGKELVSLIKDLRDTNKDLQKRLLNVETGLTKTLDQAGRGFAEAEGTVKSVKSFLVSNEDNLGSLLTHLNETSRNLEALSEDLRFHPWKVVWKEDGALDTVPVGAEQWREKGRIGPYGK